MDAQYCCRCVVYPLLILLMTRQTIPRFILNRSHSRPWDCRLIIHSLIVSLFARLLSLSSFQTPIMSKYFCRLSLPFSLSKEMKLSTFTSSFSSKKEIEQTSSRQTSEKNKKQKTTKISSKATFIKKHKRTNKQRVKHHGYQGHVVRTYTSPRLFSFIISSYSLTIESGPIAFSRSTQKRVFLSKGLDGLDAVVHFTRFPTNS